MFPEKVPYLVKEVGPELTRLTSGTELRVPRPFRLAERLMVPSLRRGADDDLEKLKNLLESKTGERPVLDGVLD